MLSVMKYKDIRISIEYDSCMAVKKTSLSMTTH